MRRSSPASTSTALRYGRDIELTDAGIEHVERLLGCGSLHDAANLRLLTALSCALHAQSLLRRDVDYIVRDGRIEVVDEFTGGWYPIATGPMACRRLEAKEGLERRSDGQILGSLTLQGFLRGYPRLCGMTGTAQTCAEELSDTYGLKVVVVPPHRPVIRADSDHLIYTHATAKEQEIRRRHPPPACDRPPDSRGHGQRNGVGIARRQAPRGERAMRGAEREERCARGRDCCARR